MVSDHSGRSEYRHGGYLPEEPPGRDGHWALPRRRYPTANLFRYRSLIHLLGGELSATGSYSKIEHCGRATALASPWRESAGLMLARGSQRHFYATWHCPGTADERFVTSSSGQRKTEAFA